MALTNPIIEILDQAQDGNLVVIFGAAAGINESQARAVLDTLTKDIALQIAKLAGGSDRYDDLIDILDDDDHDEYLDDPQELLSRDAIEDGEDILTICYGSLERAHAVASNLDTPRGVDSETFQRIMTLAATLTLSALSRRNRVLQLGLAGLDAGRPAPRGFIATMISAIVTGFLEGFKQATTRKRTRRRSTLSEIFGKPARKRRSKKTRKRRRRSPSLNDLLGDLIKG